MTHRPKELKQMAQRLEKFVLDRDKRPPHESLPRKNCRTCGMSKKNDFVEYPAVKWGNQKFKKYTTGPTCKNCCAKAISEGLLQKSERWRRAGEAMDEDVQKGVYLAKK